MKVYPIYLNQLHVKKTILIGGNHEAERKAGELLACDADLTIISESLSPALQELAAAKRFTWIPRGYQNGDLEGAFLVIVAEYTGDLNKRIFEEAESRGVLVNVMDDIPHCNFAFGSMVKRGALTISISTSGAAPTLAVRLKEKFEREFGDEFARFLDLMQKLRKPMIRFHPDFDDRKRLWYRLVDSEILEFMKDGDNKAAINKAAEIVGYDVLAEMLIHEESQAL